MLQNNRTLTMCALLLALGSLAVPPTVLAQSATAALQLGDAFPDISGQALSGKPLQLSSVIGGKAAIVVFSFSKAAGKDARSWNERISKDYCSDHSLACSTVIMLASAPRLLRGVIVSRLKRTIPPSIRRGTIVSYQKEDVWKQRLAVTDGSRAYVFRLDQSGRIRWRNSGAFSEAEYKGLKNAVSEQFQTAKPH